MADNTVPKNNEINKNKVKRLALIAILIASAAALQLLEAPLPRILPWLKLGLANTVTLYALIKLSGGASIAIAALRTCLAALFFGSVFSPIHMLSFAGAFSAAVIMTLIYKFLPKTSIGIISISGAITSNIAQLLVVQFMFASNVSLWFHIALIVWIGIPSGLIVGRITTELLKRTNTFL